MKRYDRQRAIIELLVNKGELTVDDLANRFVVSKMTIHRDLDDLENEGLLRKVRGGATIEANTRFESDFRFREGQDIEAKAAMADAALTLVEPGMTIMVNDGSMAAVLGSRLARMRPLTVITNNAAVIDALRTEPGISLIALGGTYSAKFNAFFGAITETALAGLRADIAFISSPAVSGVEAFHMDDGVVRAKRAMMASATRRCLLVNHQRFQRTALHKLAALDEFDSIITDRVPPGAAMAALETAGLALTVAMEREAAE
ncbi:DeoR/GlpR family DNA-binding transcription regulator [Aliiruegeria lutimaris]|uniref:Transcriptional regulator, DeoR family n=1 Tax=Aliiruegeria lutimaris TaxID=571298 RepID=A0A1G8UFJ0_9RHOB|nr:DeoR/GlpR family DNA-binding transcription regulator [Aliiruegeria lutimaris]SDJ52646.1 transcriptional regulator, DeoR family [Aliiruegeria lutimaris]